MSEAHDAFSTIIHVTASDVIHGGHFIKNTAGVYAEASSARVSVGVLAQTEDCAANDLIPVCVMGPCKVWCDGDAGAITPGSYIASNSSGHGVVDSTAGHRIIGVALEALASGTAFIEVLIYPSLG